MAWILSPSITQEMNFKKHQTQFSLNNLSPSLCNGSIASRNCFLCPTLVTKRKNISLFFFFYRASNSLSFDFYLHTCVRSKFSNTRCWFGWFLFNFFSSQVVTSIYQGKLESPLIKVTLRMTFLSRQSSCVVIVPSQLANHAWLRIIVPTYWVCTLGLFTQLQNQFLP